MDKIILEKSRIEFSATKNTPKAPKILGKFSKTLLNIMNPNKVFRAHENIVAKIKEKY